MARRYCGVTGCAVEATLAVVGGRWKPVLLFHLLEGRKRFSDLCRAVPNATQRMITLQLRELEADGVVVRHVYAQIPPRVEYELTELGRSLEALLFRCGIGGNASGRRRKKRSTTHRRPLRRVVQTGLARRQSNKVNSLPDRICAVSSTICFGVFLFSESAGRLSTGK